ncbi:CheY-like chemotaxis protein [Mycoplana sp. BE70]|uniref:response regulator n=1 Tax=Mycoplana sp. BE70 TaxID=2817775 RepID=UPI00285EDFC6|nr:response regulator [Mycoplana sp. BE70]MDR6758924.1 CheY-like chemotaxis protein [Mycoplana sp. BE70]
MTTPSTDCSLFAGRRILVVEDEYLLADECRKKLEKYGATVIGPTGSVQQALRLIADQAIDAAILDVHLGGELVFPVADQLIERGIAFVFATGYDPSIVPDRFPGFVLCDKPLALEKIAKALFGPPQPNGH